VGVVGVDSKLGNWLAESGECCKWDHVRPCAEIPGYDEPVCACGCSGYDERCGTDYSNHPDDIKELNP
jgi:hypothetical protein